jgi:hypothetical protein
MRNVLDKLCRNKTHILCSKTFFWKSHRLWHNVEKYAGTRGITNYVTILRLRVACWVKKATCTDTHAHAHALGSTHKHARAHTHTCNIYFFSHSNSYSVTRLSVTLYLPCLSCFTLLYQGVEDVDMWTATVKTLILYLLYKVSVHCVTVISIHLPLSKWSYQQSNSVTRYLNVIVF